MENLGKGLFIAIGFMGLIALLSVISGTILYWIWPVAIPAVFPGLVTSGVLASKLSWWSAVCLSWITSILFKSYSSNTSK